MKASRVSTTLRSLLPIRQPVFLWGAPGIGKSAVVAQVAATSGLELQDISALLLDPVDLRGLPFVAADGRSRWAAPGFLPAEGASGILFFDELNAAPAMVQASLYQLVLDRKLGEYRLPDGWAIIAAGNREGDRAVTTRMPTPLRNRFVHIDFEVDADDWSLWAIQSGIRPEVIAFIRFRPTLLSAFDRDATAFPSPRCYDEETEVYTEHGFKFWREITADDRLATLNPQGIAEFHKPKSLYRYDYDGEMIHFREQHLDLMVTPNHNVLIQRCYMGGGAMAASGRDNPDAPSELVQAQDLSFDGTKSVRMRKDCTWKTPDLQDVFTLPRTSRRRNEQMPALDVPASAWFEFLGWYIADGTTRKASGCNVWVTQTDQAKRERVHRLMLSMSFNAHLCRDRVQVANKQLFEALDPLGKRSERRVPRYVMEAHPDLMRAFLRGLVGGDGWDCDGTTYIATGLSKHVADAVQEIMIRLGGTASIRYRSCTHCWTVGLMTTRYCRPKINPENVDRVAYRGRVYCAAVPNHTLLVRRNGAVVWSGNSWEFVSRILNADPDSAVEYELIAGAVGSGAATEFTGFLRMFRELPSIDAILLNPAAEAVPESPAAQYAVASALAQRATDTNFDRVYTYVARMPVEFRILSVRDASLRDPSIKYTNAYVKWAVENHHVLA
jgi:hypothetical protein